MGATIMPRVAATAATAAATRCDSPGALPHRAWRRAFLLRTAWWLEE